MAEEPQHVNPDGNTDAEKGAKIGGVGGAVTGAVAGSMAGPAGAIIGAVVGGVAGAAASGAAVGAVDKHDGDDPDMVATTYPVSTATPVVPVDGPRPIIDNGIPGVQTGGHAIDGTPDTRGITEKAADAVTGDRIDDKTGKVVR